MRNKFVFLAVLAVILSAPGNWLAGGEAERRSPARFATNGEDTDVSNAYAYPVPFRPSAGHQSITFILLPGQGSIKIYTMAGQLVRDISFSSPVDGKVIWDVKDNDGEDLASNVYVYVVSSGDNKKYGKLLVVR